MTYKAQLWRLVVLFPATILLSSLSHMHGSHKERERRDRTEMIQDSSARFCPSCGKPIAAPDMAFCAYCGRALLTMHQAPSIGRMIGVMLGVVGVLLVLVSARLYFSITVLPFLLAGRHTYAYEVLGAADPVLDYVVLIVPLCYWLALLRLRVASLARVIPEVLAASVAVIFISATLVNLYQFFAYGAMTWIVMSFGFTRLLLSGRGFALGVLTPLLLGAGIGVGAALLFTRWNVGARPAGQMSNRNILHFTLVCGSFVGFALLDVFLRYSLSAALVHVRNPYTLLSASAVLFHGMFAICVVIVASIWMRQKLQATPLHHVAMPGAAAQPTLATPYATSVRANIMPAEPTYPAPPSLSSGVPPAVPQHEPAQQTPPGEPQA